MSTPSFLQPFVLPAPEADRSRHGVLDIYRSPAPAGERRPVVVFVHGGPLPPALRPTPRDWPIYIGYASLAAHQAMIGVMAEHRLHSPADYPLAAADIAAAVDQARALPDADPDRVALWFFSGAALLAADWLAAPPPRWLRCIAATYPVLAPLPGWDVDPRYRPMVAAATTGCVPMLVTKVGRENPDVAAAVDAFIAEATQHRQLDVIDVPEGQHGFDMLDHTDASRAAVTQAMAWVTETLRSPARS